MLPTLSELVRVVSPVGVVSASLARSRLLDRID
jgi:hypothetical protein